MVVCSRFHHRRASCVFLMVVDLIPDLIREIRGRQHAAGGRSRVADALAYLRGDLGTVLHGQRLYADYRDRHGRADVQTGAPAAEGDTDVLCSHCVYATPRCGRVDLHVPVQGTSVGTDAVVSVASPAYMRAWNSVWWGNQSVLVATLVPFPSLCEIQRSTFAPHASERVYDHLAAEDTVCGVFLAANPGDAFVVAAGETLNTITRHQIGTAHTFTPVAAVAGHGSHDNVSDHRVVTLQIPSGNFYVPLSHIQEVMDRPGSGVVQLVSTSICWEHVARSDHVPYRRPLPVHFLRRLPLRTGV